MKVYIAEYREKMRHTIFLQPATIAKSTEWVDEHGKPKMFNITFELGVADVPDSVGQFMIDQGIAKRSFLILPEGVES